jgi:hypothetical protein
MPAPMSTKNSIIMQLHARKVKNFTKAICNYILYQTDTNWEKTGQTQMAELESFKLQNSYKWHPF